MQQQQQGLTPAVANGHSFPQNYGAPASMAGAMSGNMQGMNLNQQQMQMRMQQSIQFKQQQQLLQQQQMLQNGQQRPGMMQPAQGLNPTQPPAQGMAPSDLQVQARMQQEQKARSWLAGLQNSLRAQGRPFNPNPTIGGRTINLYFIWVAIVQNGFGFNISQQNKWDVLAASLGVPNSPTAGQELKHAYELYLAHFERQYVLQRQAQQRQMQQPQQQAPAAASGLSMGNTNGPQAQSETQGSPAPSTMQNSTPTQGTPIAASFNSQFPPGVQRQGSIPAAGNASTAKGSPIMPNQPAPPQHVQIPPLPPMQQAHMQQPQPQPQAPTIQQPTAPSKENTPLKGTPNTKPVQPPSQDMHMQPVVRGLSAAPEMSSAVLREGSIASVKPVEQITEYEPKKYIPRTFGGYDVVSLYHLGTDISHRIPDLPAVFELGVIDIRALTLSMQSGIHSEVRYAIDTVAQLVVDQRIVLDLGKCEDLTEALIECAQDQLDILSQTSTGPTESLILPTYEELVKSAAVESKSLLDLAMPGTSEYEAERAAERLIGLSTILRNLSFLEHNHPFLATEPVVQLLSNISRLLGTREQPLRSFINTVDLYKDLVTLLSNISHTLVLSNREDVLCILNFLLVFAPQPPGPLPAAKLREADRGAIEFSSYSPAMHRYLAHATDSLAKLLARQEPNRVLFRSIFNTAMSDNMDEAHTLLTRTFGLAVAVVPDYLRGPMSDQEVIRIVDAREAVLTQGLLAADILASLVPVVQSAGQDQPAVRGSSLARRWLESQDGWAASLMRTVCVLLAEPTGATPAHHGSQPMPSRYGLITYHGLSMLEKLASRVAESAAMGTRIDPRNDDQEHGRSGDGDRDDLAVQEQLRTSSTEALEDVRPTGAASGEDRANNKAREGGKLRKDALPHRETVIGAFAKSQIDPQSIKLLAKLYDLVVAG